MRDAASKSASLEHELFGDIHDAADRPARRRRLRAADRLHQRRESSAGALRSPAARDRRAHRPRRGPRPRAASTRHRKLRAGVSRRRRRPAAGQLGRQGPDGRQPDHFPELHPPGPRPARGALHRAASPAPSACSSDSLPPRRSRPATSTMPSSRRPATPPISRGGRRFRGALVVAEVAFAMLLLVGAGLMIRSVQQLAAIRPGYDPGASSHPARQSAASGAGAAARRPGAPPTRRTV